MVKTPTMQPLWQMRHIIGAISANTKHLLIVFNLRQCPTSLNSGPKGSEPSKASLSSRRHTCRPKTRTRLPACTSRTCPSCPRPLWTWDHHHISSQPPCAAPPRPLQRHPTLPSNRGRSSPATTSTSNRVHRNPLLVVRRLSSWSRS